jgi:hypothetical protein
MWQRLADHPQGMDSLVAGGKTAKRSPPPEDVAEKPTPTGVAELWHPCQGAVRLKTFSGGVAHFARSTTGYGSGKPPACHGHDDPVANDFANPARSLIKMP